MIPLTNDELLEVSFVLLEAALAARDLAKVTPDQDLVCQYQEYSSLLLRALHKLHEIDEERAAVP